MSSQPIPIPESLPTQQTIDTTPFKRLVTTFGGVPTDFKESMTYYELLAWLVNYFQTVVIPKVNENTEATNLVITTFNNLKDWIDHYFDNLDVQEEINNKLDAMVEDGTLEQLININKLYNFSSLQEAKNFNGFSLGEIFTTSGYYTANDNGNAEYIVEEYTDQTIDEGEFVELSVEGLIAHLINVKEVNVKVFGAKGDGETDDSSAIQNAINYVNKYAITTQQEVPTNPDWKRYFSTSLKVKFPTAKYIINTPIDLSGSRYYYLDGCNSYIEATTSLSIFNFSSYGGTKCNIERFIFNKVRKAIVFDNSNLDTSTVVIEKCKFIGTTNYAIDYNNRSSILKIKDSLFSWCYGIFKNVMCDSAEFEDCWFAEYEASENNYHSFELLWGENKFINCLFIPNGNYNPDIQQENYTNMCWIQAGDNTTAVENNPSILIDRCRVSSEVNSKTLINWKVIPNGGTNPCDTYIRIINSYQLAAALGDTIIKLWHLPQQITISNSDVRIEDNQFITLDDSLNIDTELSTYHTSPNRSTYNLDYSISNVKTQTITPWRGIPEKLIGFFRNTDFDVQAKISSTSGEVVIPLGMLQKSTTYAWNKVYLVKAFFNPINSVSGLSSVTGLLMFDAVNSTVESTAAIRVKFVKLAQYAGGSSLTEDDDITIIPTFDGTSNIVQMSGNAQISLHIKLDNVTYDNGHNYITIKQI